VDFFDFVFTLYLGITKIQMKIMGQHLIIFSIENPSIYLTLFFPHHLGITKIHMKIMGMSSTWSSFQDPPPFVTH
jgi:hypothetical protein